MKNKSVAIHTSLLCALASFAFADDAKPQPAPADQPPAAAAASNAPKADEAPATPAPQPETPPTPAPEANIITPSTPPTPAAELKLQKRLTSYLDQSVINYRGEEESIPNALQLLARTYNLTIVADPDVTGKTTFQVPRGTVRDVLNSICQPAGYYFEEAKDNNRYITVKKNKVVLYTIEYPQLQRNSTENSNVTLSGGSNSNSNGNGSSVYGSNTSSNGTNGSTGGNSSMNDQTSIQITSKNEGDFWAGVNDEIKGMLLPGETFFINKFTGIVKVKASPRRHEEDIAPYIAMLNQIINEEVYIDAQILEVVFNDQAKLGVDWTQAAASIGNAVDVKSAASSTNVLDVGSTSLAPNTFTATLAAGKLSAVVNALKQQGTVTSKSNPRISTLNNQTAIITVGTEKTFFSVDTSFQQTTASTTAYSSTTQKYVKDKYTFGVVLKATPYVRRDGSITIDLLPSISKLVGVDRAPDNLSTSPNVDQKRVSTIVRLRPGEAAVIGGMISETEGTQTNSVPLLGSIPGVGRLFRTEATNKARSEIVIILTASTKKPLAETTTFAQTPVASK